MSIISGLMNHTIDTISSITKDGWSNVTRTTVYSDIPCRWEETIGKVISPEQEEKTYRVNVWLTPDYVISYGYEFYKDSEYYKVLRIEKKYDISGIWDHTKVYLV
jgi:hypothetical protein